MEVKKEDKLSPHIKTIKKEALPDDPFPVIKSERIVSESENEVFVYQVPELKVKNELEEDTSYEDVKFSSCFLSNSHAVSNKKEENDVDGFKSELLNDACDLPDLKDEDEANVDCHDSHPDSSKQNVLSCSVCQKGFASPISVDGHLNSHFDNATVTCVCGNAYTDKNVFLMHNKTHNQDCYDDKRFQCVMCSKEFKRKDYLKNHTRIHTGEKPYRCNVCFKGFSQNQHLHHHLKIHGNGGPDDKKYQCDVCLRRFRKNSNLVCHLRIHTGEKPFRCEICSKQFSQGNDLTKHTRIHTGEKPFQCDICSKRFTQSQHLAGHLKRHNNSDEKMFRCDFCPKKFRKKQRLQNHVKIHASSESFSSSLLPELI